MKPGDVVSTIQTVTPTGKFEWRHGRFEVQIITSAVSGPGYYASVMTPEGTWIPSAYIPDPRFRT